MYKYGLKDEVIMKIKETRMETNDQGEWKVQEQSNGISVRILKNPSEEYKKKLKDRQGKQKISDDIQKGRLEQDRLIKDRMREIAVRELQEEGKL